MEGINEENAAAVERALQELSPVTRLSDIAEKAAAWLVTERIPRGQITILVGDGGVGKTTVWAALAAAVSTGAKVFFDTTPDFSPDKPGKVLFLSAEDDVACVLKPRLCKAGANEENLLTIPLTDTNFSEYKIGSEKLENVVKLEMPELLILDPLQAFLSSEVRMESRNAMRNTLNSLVQIGARYGTTILVVMHTNKRPGAHGRGRVADSADIWDIVRSVLIVGNAGKGVRYLSHEKCNYGQLAETVLFTLDDKGAHFEGTTDKRDRDFIQERNVEEYKAPKREEAKEFILNFLEDGQEHEMQELEESASAAGIKKETLKTAKTELKTEKKIRYWPRGFKDKKYFIQLAEDPS